MINISEMWKYDLRRGNTDHPANGACLYDAAKWIVYGQIGDDPECACPVIRGYAIRLNDSMPTDVRQRLLKPMILRVVGNRDPSAEAARLRYIVEETIVAFVAPPEDEARVRAMTYADLRVYCREAERKYKYKYKYEYAATAAAAALAAALAAAAAHAAAYAVDAAAAHADADADADAAAAHAAAYAVDAAAAHADADAAAAHAAASKIWEKATTILDGALRIGKQSPEFCEEEVAHAVAAFERARETI